MSKLYLRDWDWDWDTNDIQINKSGDIIELIDHWLIGKQAHHIFVCFHTWIRGEDEAQLNFVITSIPGDVSNYAKISERVLYDLHISNTMVDFNVFEFSTWEEAFLFCNDLQEHCE